LRSADLFGWQFLAQQNKNNTETKIMSATVHRDPTTGVLTIEVPARGEHMGRNGYAHIQKLRLLVLQGGTVDLNSINSKGATTNGGMLNVPIVALVELVDTLKAELTKALLPPEEASTEKTP
jgi:hypothetical protein